MTTNPTRLSLLAATLFAAGAANADLNVVAEKATLPPFPETRRVVTHLPTFKMGPQRRFDVTAQDGSRDCTELKVIADAKDSKRTVVLATTTAGACPKTWARDGWGGSRGLDTSSVHYACANGKTMLLADQYTSIFLATEERAAPIVEADGVTPIACTPGREKVLI